MSDNNKKKKISQKALLKTTRRALLFENSINFERMQSFSFTYAMIPVLKDLYSNTEDLIKGLKRHLEFFNSNVFAVFFIIGATASLEEQKANGEAITDDTINSVKAGLMGPGAGIGDALFWGTFVPLVGGITAAMGAKGNIFAPILHQIIRVGFWLFISHFGVKFGYEKGLELLDKAGSAGIEKITKGATLLAATVIGGLVATLVNAQTDFVFKSGEVSIDLQADLLDPIAPNLIPLMIFILIYYLLKKRKWSPISVIGFVFVFGIISSFLNILVIP
ncbi:MAG: PTS system mannose/fructose/sorbose family transporter subunit IID [Bacillota bacterium]